MSEVVRLRTSLETDVAAESDSCDGERLQWVSLKCVAEVFLQCHCNVSPDTLLGQFCTT